MNVEALHAGLGVQSVQRTVQEKPVTEQAEPRIKQPVQAADSYSPEDKDTHAAIGLYRVVQEDGVPRVEFDDPEAAPAREAEKSSVTTMDTDKVDREIEQLRKRQEELARQVDGEKNPQRKEQLERQLAQVEQELSRKDNDGYRRQHAEIS